MNAETIKQWIPFLLLVTLAGCVPQKVVVSRSLLDLEGSAKRFYPDNLSPITEDLQLVPNWIFESDVFWYKKKTASGRQYIRVDARTGVQSPAFDHQRLAASLSKMIGTQLAATNLSFSYFDYFHDVETISFVHQGETFVCSTSNYACDQLEVDENDDGEVSSPDGARAVYAKDNNLWIRFLDGAEDVPLTHDGHPDSAYRYIAFNTTAIEERRQLVPRRLPAARWSPDSRYVLAVKTSGQDIGGLPYVVEYLAPDDSRPIVHTMTVNTPGGAHQLSFDLVLIDTVEGDQVSVDGGVFGFHDYAPHWALQNMPSWDMDAQELYLVTSTRDSRGLGVIAVDLATGNSRMVISEDAMQTLNLNHNDYRMPNVRFLPARGEILWWSERDGWGHLYRYNAKSGLLINAITSGQWTVTDLLRVDEQSGVVYFMAAGREPGRNPYYRHLYRSNLDGTNVQIVTPEDADHSYTNNPGRSLNAFLTSNSIRFSPSGRYYVDTHSTLSLPPVTKIRDLEGGLVSHIATADVSQLESLGWSAPERFVVPTADGSYQLYGAIVKPTYFDENNSYPVIEHIYGGPQTVFGPQAFSDYLGERGSYMQSLAEFGFVIVVMDGRGTPRRSRDFHMHPRNTEDVFGIADHVHAIQTLGERHSYMDINRVGIYGVSFGGYAAARAMFLFPDFYKVGVSIAGPHDYRRMVSSISVERFFGVPTEPGERHDYYTMIDNIHLANRLEGKLMLVYGEIDQNVPFNQAMAISDALIKADKDFQLVLVPNAPHSVSSHPYAHRRIRDFLVSELSNR